MKSTRVVVLSLVMSLCAGAALAAQPGEKKPETPPAAPAPKPAEPAKDAAPKEPAPKAEPGAKPGESAPAADKFVTVNMKTSMGDIVLELNETKAPISTKNFLAYAEKGHYDGTIFHRVIDGFMIQGGGFGPDGQQKPTDAPIKNEWQNGLKNTRGTIAMARTAAADSATSQFYINVSDNAPLDQPRGGAAYAVFGRVVSGMDVVDKIKAVKTAKQVPGSQPKPALPAMMRPDQPVEPVSIVSVKRVESAK